MNKIPPAHPSRSAALIAKAPASWCAIGLSLLVSGFATIGSSAPVRGDASSIIHQPTGLTIWHFPYDASSSAGPRLTTSASSAQSASAVTDDAIRNALKTVAPVFRINLPESQLRRTKVRVDSLGWTHVEFQQIHKGIEVFSGVLRLHFDSAGDLRSVNGRHYPIGDAIPGFPSISSDEAGAVAVDLIGGFEPRVWSSELVIVDPGWYGDASLGARLAYYIIVEDAPVYREEALFVDATTGEVLDRWSLNCTALNREIYDANGSSQLPGGLIRDEGSPPNGDPEIDRLYDYLGDTYDYFQLGFGRDSYDDQGSTIIASAYYNFLTCATAPNASWSFIHRRMWFCQGTTHDDIVAHELTHGVTQYSANLIYQNQPGQLNESFSDIFGELVDLFNSDSAFAGSGGATPWTAHSSGPGVDAPNNARSPNLCSYRSDGHPDGVRWLIGEDSPVWNAGLRDMWRPTCFQHPDRANAPLQTCNPLDNGGVHSGSGVLNHAFAIACDGKTFNGQTVSGVGPIKAGAIWYRALTVYLTVASDFQDAYYAINQAASDLVGTVPLDPRTGLPSQSVITAADAAEVNKALLAVELNTAGSCGKSVPVLDSSEPPTCTTPIIVYADDFENGAEGWTVENTAIATPYDWQLVGSLPFDRPGTSWFCDNPNIGDCASPINEEGVHSLISPPIVIPAGLETLTLEFTHFVESEPRFDGGNVSIRVNGGDWHLLPAVAFFYNRYNTSLFPAQLDNTNPIGGQLSFTGVGGRWGTSLVDISSFAATGDIVQVRFDFGKDGCFGFTGWFVDDLRIYGCASSADCDANGIPDEMDAQLGNSVGIVLSQSPNKSTGSLSDADPHPSLGVNKLAEDFTLIRAVEIDSVRLWGAYTGNTPVPDSFTVNFYTAAAGVPGMLLASFSGLSADRSQTGSMFLGVNEYEYWVQLPAALSLGAGDYFIEVFNDTTGAITTWIWERALFGWIPGSARFGQSCQTYCRDEVLNFAIQLIGRYNGIRRGDVNLDGHVTLDDVVPFIEALLVESVSSDVHCAVDINRDGAVDGADVTGFVECLLNSGCP